MQESQIQNNLVKHEIRFPEKLTRLWSKITLEIPQEGNIRIRNSKKHQLSVERPPNSS